MEINILKVQCNGTAHVVAEIPQADRADVSELAIKICDIRGPVGADAFVFVRQVDQHKIMITPYAANGSEQSFSVNSSMAAALYHQHRFQKNVCQVRTNLLSLPVRLMERSVPHTFDLIVEEIPIAFSDELMAVNADAFGNIKHCIFASNTRYHIFIFNEFIDDNNFLAIARSATWAPADNFLDGTLNLIKVLQRNSIFVRTYDFTTNELVDSCSAAEVASVAALSRTDTSIIEKTIAVFSMGGKSFVSISPLGNSNQSSGRISARGGFVYSANLVWSNGILGKREVTGQRSLEGQAYLGSIVNLGQNRDDDLKSINLETFYRPTYKR